jgi:chromosome partitioning protein
VDVLAEGLDIRQAILKTDYPRLHILPCNRNKVKEEHLHIGRFTDGEYTLKNAVSYISGDYNYMLVDCPPSLAEMTVNAVTASSHVYIPLRIDSFSFDGIKEMSKKVAEIKLNHNDSVELSGVFVTMDEKTTVNKQIKDALKDTLGDTLMDSYIRKTAKVIESTFYGKPVVDYDPKCTASRDYWDLADEMLLKIK